MDEFEIELKNDFLEESTDLLEAAEEAFLKLETERDNPELLNEIFRLAHNLKGTSKAVGFDQLAELTHVAENLILKLKEGSLFVTDSIVSTLLNFKDKVNEMVEGYKENLDANFDNISLISKIEEEVNKKQETAETSMNECSEEVNAIESHDDEIINVPDSTNSAFEDIVEINKADETPAINSAALESLKESGIDVTALEENEKKNIDVEEPTHIADKNPDVQIVKKAETTFEDKTKLNSKKTVEKDESIRVRLSRIDKINNVIGELVILQTVVSQRRYEFIQDDLTNKSIGMMSKLFKEVQEIAMSLRMLPLKTTFQKMNRIVRDTSKMLGKDVNLHLFGEETEVDKTVLEKLADPLVHIIRNAVDHGLETSDIRVNAGKEAKGNVELFAYHEGSNLVIQITDDGKGIDPEVIRKKAIEKGIISQREIIPDQEMIQYIFHPGFSTKEQVTEVSGRGVGMDVVKTNIEALGGEVKLMSKLGEGSSLKIILPLTLAIIEGIVIKSENEKFVLPLSQIYEISQVKAADVQKFSGVAKLFELRGEVLPLFNINEKIGKKENTSDESLTVIVVRGLSYAFGVAVEDILNQQQIVIKKLGDDIKNKKGIIGSAIMADGKPSLILDLLELFKEDLKSSKGHKKFLERSLRSA